MGTDEMIYLISNLFGMILLFWIVINFMINDKKIKEYIPFYVIGFFLFIATIFLFFEIWIQEFWVLVEFSLGSCLLFIFVKIVRIKNGTN